MKCSNCNKEFKSNELYDLFDDGIILMCKECAKQFVKQNKHYKKLFKNLQFNYGRRILK